MTAVLLLDTGNDVIGVNFPSTDAARDWEDAHPEVASVGCVTIISKRDSLDRFAAPPPILQPLPVSLSERQNRYAHK